MSKAAPQSAEIVLRDARADDCPDIQEIYAHHVLNGVASFEESPPDLPEIQRRLEASRSLGLPYLVAVSSTAVDGILGFATAGPYRTRPAYRSTLENTVYLRDGHGGAGIGSLLLGRLIAQCDGLGYRQMIAVIGDSANQASIRLHQRHGFEQAGLLRSVGFKHGRWLDSVLMQRPLGPGDTTLPKA